jgi:hypothetical protein
MNSQGDTSLPGGHHDLDQYRALGGQSLPQGRTQFLGGGNAMAFDAERLARLSQLEGLGVAKVP